MISIHLILFLPVITILLKKTDVMLTPYGQVPRKTGWNEYLYAYIFGMLIKDIFNYIFTRRNDLSGCCKSL